MKKIFLTIVVVLLAIGGFLVHNELNQKAVIKNGIDERGKEHLKKQGSKSDALRYADLDEGKNDTRSGNVAVDDCFSFSVPFAITHSRTEAKCEATYGIPSGGNIVVYKRQGQGGGFDSIPGVSLRRLEKEKYTEETKTLNGKTFLIFTAKEEQVKNAFYHEDGFYFVLNLFAPYSSENDKKFLKMLESVKFI